MNRVHSIGLAAFAVAVVFPACNTPSENQRVFFADLKGENEVPAVSTAASGRCGFALEGQTMRYTIEVHGLTSIRGAHIHLANAGANGPIRVFLHPAVTGPAFNTTGTGAVNGVLIEGTFGPSNVSGGVSFDSLLAAMTSGGAYCNVHTDARLGGEVRGQIFEVR